jgi:hypothetical protein
VGEEEEEKQEGESELEEKRNHLQWLYLLVGLQQQTEVQMQELMP